MLSQSAKRELLDIARQTLSAFVKGQPLPTFKVQNKALLEPHGAFVTLKVSEKLRGCLGLMTADEPLELVVQRQTCAAAASDPRFEKIQPDELSAAEIEISVLSPLKKISSWEEIKLGHHGVMVKRGLRSGVFLPQVAGETGWDRETFLENLCVHKAGLPPESYKDAETEIYVFEVEKVKGQVDG